MSLLRDMDEGKNNSYPGDPRFRGDDVIPAKTVIPAKAGISNRCSPEQFSENAFCFRKITPGIAGFTLIEVLVSLTLLAIILLGLDAVNCSSLRLAKSIYHRHLAELEYENKIEMQRAAAPS